MLEARDELNRSLNEYVALVGRRRWWFVLSACGTTLATILGSLMLPNYYRSQATILVEQQKVSERYVVSTANSNLSDQLEAMTQDILSRTRLLQVIDEFGLFSGERKRLTSEELVGRMRREIEVKPLSADPQRRDFNAFRISFTGRDPYVVQRVTGRLTSLFIEENLKMRERLASGTTNFLQEQLEQAQNEMQKQQQQLRDFKMRYIGELPEQQHGNLEILSGLHMELQNVMGGLARAQQQRVYLESLLTQYRSLTALGGAQPGLGGLSTMETVQRDLDRLRSQRATLLAHYTPQHPEVVKINQEIEQSEALLERLTKASKAPGDQKAQASTASSGNLQTDTAIAQLNSQLEANGVELENLKANEKRLKGEIAEYEHRLNLEPVVEQQLADLLSNYNQAKQNYEDLLNKRNQSELATSLEKSQQGQQFRIVDPPSLSTKPSSPKRFQISLMGALLGTIFGVCLAFLAEVRDRSVRTEEDVRQHFSIPLVIGLPQLLSPAEKQKRSWKRSVEWVAGSALVLAVFAFEFYLYWRG